jgi:hypothetical protein
MQIVFDLVLLMEAVFRFGRLWPQVGDVVTPAVLQGDVVIDSYSPIVRSRIPYSRYTSRLTAAGTLRTAEMYPH